MSSEELRLFDKIRVFLDEDYSSAEHFTVGEYKNYAFIKCMRLLVIKLNTTGSIFQALGNFYFVHESLKEVLLWDFQGTTYLPR